jgi:hypothetical protein
MFSLNGRPMQKGLAGRLSMPRVSHLSYREGLRLHRKSVAKFG